MKNRGKHPNDDKFFGSKWHPILKEAVSDLSFLITRNYGSKSAVQLVGNRYRLNSRQQKALLRMSADTDKIVKRNKKQVTKAQLAHSNMWIDGFNLLILLENALSGAFIFKCKDGTYRDISSVHGSYKKVIQTEEAIVLVGNLLQSLQVNQVVWYFDAPVSNSGRIKVMLLELAEKHSFNWQVHLVNNPDTVLAASKEIVVSSDAWILDECEKWYNLGTLLVEEHLKVTEIIYAE